MKFSYDLIIIGCSVESIWAAEYAVSFGARIALIVSDYYLTKYLQKLVINELYYTFSSQNNLVNLTHLIAERKRLIIEQSLPKLEEIGVDIIFHKVKFYQEKKLILKTDKYILEANNYLLTTNSLFVFEMNHNNSYKNCLNIDDLINKNNWQNLPNNLVIIGDDLITINLAQILAKLKKQVTIITQKKQLLPKEDQEIIFTLQANLEAQGITLLTNSKVTQIKLIDGYKWIQAGDKAIETQEIIITNSIDQKFAQMNLDRDNLELNKLGIDFHFHKIIVNNKLQTSHPQIYACGDILGGYNLSNLAQYEAKIAVENALFLPLKQINYQLIPYCLQTYPHILRIGYTETQARQIYDRNLQIIKFRIVQELENIYHQQPATFIKIILDNQDYIIGTHFFNLDNPEIMTAISMMMTQNKTINCLFKLSFCDMFSQEIVKQLYNQWQQYKRQKNKLLTNLLETFFLWKRN